ncbi:MAG: GntR family transcriptional regulator [Acholeplasmataceae bacterium]|nr:GntR family transcriptional regulator [Acholeplasmataceae bacterium]
MIPIYIDKFSKVPIYKQIMKAIENAIYSNQLRHLDKLPTEKDLCDLFGLSRSVIRKAYEELIKNGLVMSKQGYGTFVNRRYRHKGTVKDIFSFGGLAKKEVVVIGSIDYRNQVYPILGLHEGEKSYDISYRLLIDNYPISLQRAFFPYKYFPNLEKYVSQTEDFLTLITKQYNYHISGIYTDIIASESGNVESLLLNIEIKDKIFFATTRIVDSNNTIIAVILHALAGDYVTFEEVIENERY